MSSDDEYFRNLERWSATDLPVFRLENWDGTWLLGTSAGLVSVAGDGTHRFWGTMSQDVWHRRPDVRGDAITVRSSRPDVDVYSPQLGNMAIQLEVLAVGEVWFAFALLEDVNIEILGHHSPFTELRLTRVTDPPPAMR